MLLISKGVTNENQTRTLEETQSFRTQEYCVVHHPLHTFLSSLLFTNVNLLNFTHESRLSDSHSAILETPWNSQLVTVRRRKPQVNITDLSV